MSSMRFSLFDSAKNACSNLSNASNGSERLTLVISLCENPLDSSRLMLESVFSFISFVATDGGSSTRSNSLSLTWSKLVRCNAAALHLSSVETDPINVQSRLSPRPNKASKRPHGRSLLARDSN